MPNDDNENGDDFGESVFRAWQQRFLAMSEAQDTLKAYHASLRAAELSNLAAAQRAKWTGQILTVSSGILAVLVALQGSYLPCKALPLAMLWICWVFLATTVLASAIALLGDSHVQAEFSRKMADNVAREPEEREIVLSARPTLLQEWSSRILPCCLAMAMLAMCAFAISNSYSSFVDPPQPPAQAK